MTEKVVLVDERDNQTGVMEKLAAHVEGKLHRAVSVFIFNNNNELLLQKRAGGKYHSPFLWTNTCCSHPRPGEEVYSAASRRLMEEMGMSATIQPVFHFLYRADVGDGLIEFEYDHVYAGISDEVPQPSSDEVCDWQYLSYDALLKSISSSQHMYTEWFKIFVRECGQLLFYGNQNTVDTMQLYTYIQD
jgi:isopentenyl-diphosphate delta-isomerase